MTLRIISLLLFRVIVSLRSILKESRFIIIVNIVVWHWDISMVQSMDVVLYVMASIFSNFSQFNY
jgi:hypothetical protein